MTDPIHEQLSAFLDGELSAAESELLVKRIERDPTLKSTLERYVLAGEALRATQVQARPSRDFSARVAAAIDHQGVPSIRTHVAQWLKPVAGGAIAAGVAAVALVSMQSTTSLVASQQRQDAASPTLTAQQTPVSGPQNVMSASNSVFNTRESESYVVPMPSDRAAPPIQVINNGQLANYIVAHSEYSSPLSRRNVLTGLIAEDPSLVAEPEANKSAFQPQPIQPNAAPPSQQLSIAPR